jgi:hypothetical protein
MPDPTVGVDQIINEAQRDGKFDDLPGKGKPLEIDTSPDAVVKGLLKHANVSVAPEWIRLAAEIDRLLEEDERALAEDAARYTADRAALEEADRALAEDACRAPEQESANWSTRLRHWLRPGPAPLTAEARRAEALNTLNRHWERALERHAARLHACNRKLRRFNQIVPFSYRQRPPLPVQERLEAFIDRFQRAERGPDGALQWVRGHVPAVLLTPPLEPEEGASRPRDVLQAAALLRMHRGQKPPPPIG